MSKYKWKDKYYSHDRSLLNEESLRFFSATGSKNGNGSRTRPYSSAFSIDLGYNYTAIFSSGVHSGSALIKSACSIGQGMYETFINNAIWHNSTSLSHLDLTFLKDAKMINNGSSWLISLRRCRIFSKLLTGLNSINHCILYDVNYAGNSKNNNAYIDLVDTGVKFHYNSNLSTFENCELALTATEIKTTYKNNYFAFQNCKFKIGNESTYSKLTGNNADELRANFVNRCTAQGIDLPVFSEFEEVNVKMGRWIFTNNSIVEGRIIRDSEVANFQKKRGIYLGWNAETVENLPIVTTNNVPNSFTPALAKGLNVKPNFIQLPNTFKLTAPNKSEIVSKPIWLGGKYRITSFLVANNLPAEYGINIDSTPNIDLQNAIAVTGSTILKKDVNYIVRSENDSAASFTYGGVTYSSSLITRNNIFVGAVDGTHLITNDINSPILIPVEDMAGQQTIKMRVVTDIPADKITQGATLQNDYWYIVEPDSPSDVTGTVKTSDGVVHPAYDAFLVTGSLGFTIQGACHLRRMWRNGYTADSEVTDLAFWENRQKPKWIDVIPSDMRCLMRNNTSSELERMVDSVTNEYITSGHANFYDLTSGANGVPLPAFDIAGTFVQFKIEITSLNPM